MASATPSRCQPEFHGQGPLQFRLNRSRMDTGASIITRSRGQPVSTSESNRQIGLHPPGTIAGSKPTRSSRAVANFVCRSCKPASVTCLTGRLLREKSFAGSPKRLVMQEEFEPILATVSHTDEAASTIWPRIEARHQALFGTQNESQLSTMVSDRRQSESDYVAAIHTEKQQRSESDTPPTRP